MHGFIISREKVKRGRKDGFYNNIHRKSVCSERIRVVKFHESKYVLLYDECSTRFLRKIKYVTNIRYDTLCSKHSVSNIFPEPPPPYGVQLITSCWIQNTSSLLKTSNTKNVWVKMWSDVNFVIINVCGLIVRNCN